MKAITPKSLRQTQAKLKADNWVKIDAGYGLAIEFHELVKEFVSDPCLRGCDAEFQAALGRVVDTDLDGPWRFTVLVLQEREGDFVEGDHYFVYGKPSRSTR
jgi:hypothetical protein